MVAKRTTSRAVKRVAKGVTAVGASGGSAVADIRAAVGTSTNPTSAGTKAVTGVGFQPKVVLPFSCPLTADGVDTYALLGFGAADGTSNGAVSVASQSGLATSNTNRRHDNTKCVSELLSALTLNTREASLSSFDSDGFTLDWSGTLSSAWLLNHICLGGDDLEASLTLHQMNGTNADESFAHGLTGGAPDALLFFNAQMPAALPITDSSAVLSIGAWGGNSQFSSCVYSLDARSTTDTRRSLADTSVLQAIFFAGLVREMAVNSVDGTNVNVTYPTTATTTEFFFHMLALRGCKAQVGTFDANGSTSAVNIPCTGITPKLFMPILLPGGVDNINTVQNGNALTIGAGDGTNTVSCGITDEDNKSIETNARRYQDSGGISEYDFDGTLETDAAISFSGESVNYTPSTNTGTTWGQGGYLIIGN